MSRPFIHGVGASQSEYAAAVGHSLKHDDLTIVANYRETTCPVCSERPAEGTGVCQLNSQVDERATIFVRYGICRRCAADVDKLSPTEREARAAQLVAFFEDWLRTWFTWTGPRAQA